MFWEMFANNIFENILNDTFKKIRFIFSETSGLSIVL